MAGIKQEAAIAAIKIGNNGNTLTADVTIRFEEPSDEVLAFLIAQVKKPVVIAVTEETR
jgi:hypothetical protein